MLLIGKPSISIRAIYFPWQTVSHNQRVMLFCFLRFSRFPHGSLNVPIEHHPTIRYMVYNGYYKVMSNIPKMGQLPTPVPPSSDFRFFGLQTNSGVASMQVAPTVFSRGRKSRYLGVVSRRKSCGLCSWFSCENPSLCSLVNTKIIRNIPKKDFKMM